jgi:hypothetical protein
MQSSKDEEKLTKSNKPQYNHAHTPIIVLGPAYAQNDRNPNSEQATLDPRNSGPRSCGSAEKGLLPA